MDLKDLVSASEKLGLTGDALRKWVEEEQARAREERAAERDARREQAEREERALVLAREKAALDEKILLLRLRLTEAEAGAGGRVEPAAVPDRVVPLKICPRSFMPPFDENRDDLDAYFRRFEVVAAGQDWPKDKWATALSMLLVGEAIKVFGRLSPADSLDYDKAKKALLQRFRYRPNGQPITLGRLSDHFTGHYVHPADARQIPWDVQRDVRRTIWRKGIEHPELIPPGVKTGYSDVLGRMQIQ